MSVMLNDDQKRLLEYAAASNALPSGTSWSDAAPLLHPLIKHALDLATISHEGDQDAFVMENEYILEQFSELHAPPFTLQRLCEILLNPTEYHIAGGKDVVRGEKLQAALRRCILVTPLE